MEKYNLKKNEIKFHNIVMAVTSEDLYDGSRFYLLESLGDLENLKHGEYVVVEGFHCSCYDFDDTRWEAFKYTEEELMKIAQDRIKNAADKKEVEFYSLVKDYIGRCNKGYDLCQDCNLAEENDELKEKFNRIKDICNKVDQNWEIVGTHIIYDIEQILYDSSDEEMEMFIDTQDIEERYAHGLYTDYLEEKINKTIDYIDMTIEMIKQMPTEDDSWILGRLYSFKNILRGEE